MRRKKAANIEAPTLMFRLNQFSVLRKRKIRSK